MKYHNITTDDMLNGDGLRVVLWVSGCNHHCKECQNPITWDPEDGLLFDEEAEKELMEKLDKDYISGLTLSGGDPLYPGNREKVTEIAKKVKERFPDKTIWLYTGYLFDDIDDLEILDYINVVVDDEFKRNLKDNTIHWRGSSNQSIYKKVEGNWYLYE